MNGSECMESLKKIRYDLTAAQARLTDVMGFLGSKGFTEKPTVRCECGVSFPSHERLEEHAYRVHDGEVPAHWADAA